MVSVDDCAHVRNLRLVTPRHCVAANSHEDTVASLEQPQKILKAKTSAALDMPLCGMFRNKREQPLSFSTLQGAWECVRRLEIQRSLPRGAAASALPKWMSENPFAPSAALGSR